MQKDARKADLQRSLPVQSVLAVAARTDEADAVASVPDRIETAGIGVQGIHLERQGLLRRAVRSDQMLAFGTPQTRWTKL